MSMNIYMKLMHRGFGNEAIVIAGEKTKVEKAAEEWRNITKNESAKYRRITREQARKECHLYNNPVFSVEYYLESGAEDLNLRIRL